jgi:hypothetical protein
VGVGVAMVSHMCQARQDAVMRLLTRMG